MQSSAQHDKRNVEIVQRTWKHVEKEAGTDRAAGL
jgi:hypothetical protein